MTKNIIALLFGALIAVPSVSAQVGDDLGSGLQRARPKAKMQRGQRGNKQRAKKQRANKQLQRFETLSLSDNQRLQVREIVQASKDRSQPLRQQIRQLRQQMRSGQLSPEAQAQIQSLRAQIKTERKTVRQQVRSILSREQLKELRQQTAARRQNPAT